MVGSNPGFPSVEIEEEGTGDATAGFTQYLIATNANKQISIFGDRMNTLNIC
jgi:hypothetical protein